MALFHNAKNEIHGYTLDEKLGRGAFGEVYKATKDNSVYAIKKIKSEKISSFETEVDVLKNLINPNILRHYDFFYYEIYYFIVTEFCENKCLRNYMLKNITPFNTDQIFKWTKEIIYGLDYLQSKNIIHRDIKPENILLTIELNAKIADFGIASIIESSFLTSEHGTIDYMSKEMLEGLKYTFKTDIWSAGCVIFELIFNELNMKYREFKNKREQFSDFKKEIPKSLSQIIKKMLIESQEHRADIKLLIETINQFENSTENESISYRVTLFEILTVVTFNLFI